MATYNGEKYLEKQLNSILLQQLKPDEIIVCDDGSTDNTVQIIEAFKQRLNVKLFVNETTLGVVGNFKKAVSLVTKGNWIVFADQDDIWVPEKLETLAIEMDRLDDDITPALVYSDLSVIDKDDDLIYLSFWDKQQIKPDKIKLSTLLYGNVVTGCTMIINHAMGKAFQAMDCDCLHDEWIALIAYTIGKVKLLNEKLVLYRQHNNNITFASVENETKPNDLANIVTYLSGSEKFLQYQFNLAKCFFNSYHHKLNKSQTKIFQHFFNQENKGYLLQRINRRITYL